MKMLRTIMMLALCGSCTATMAQVNCPPNLPLTLTGNTEYCVGSPGSQLTVEETYDQYEWLPTAETSQSVLLTAGNYQLVVTHYTGCTDTVDIEIQQVSNPPQPVITASGPTEFCAGESVTLSGPPGYPYYEWSTGSVSEQITLYENITVILSVEDWIGCVSSSNSIDIVVNPLPEAILSPDINGYNVEFNNLSVNATDYEWNFGDGSTSTDFEPSHLFTLDGEVDIYLVASNGCGSDTAFVNLTSVSMNEVELFDNFQVYPNPTSDILNLELGSKDVSEVNLSVYSIAGSNVFSIVKNLQSGQNRIVLSLADLQRGTYMLVVESPDQIVRRPILLID